VTRTHRPPGTGCHGGPRGRRPRSRSPRSGECRHGTFGPEAAWEDGESKRARGDGGGPHRREPRGVVVVAPFSGACDRPASGIASDRQTGSRPGSAGLVAARVGSSDRATSTLPSPGRAEGGDPPASPAGADAAAPERSRCAAGRSVPRQEPRARAHAPGREDDPRVAARPRLPRDGRGVRGAPHRPRPLPPSLLPVRVVAAARSPLLLGGGSAGARRLAWRQVRRRRDPSPSGRAGHLPRSPRGRTQRRPSPTPDPDHPSGPGDTHRAATINLSRGDTPGAGPNARRLGGRAVRGSPAGGRVSRDALVPQQDRGPDHPEEPPGAEPRRVPHDREDLDAPCQGGVHCPEDAPTGGAAADDPPGGHRGRGARRRAAPVGTVPGAGRGRTIGAAGEAPRLPAAGGRRERRSSPRRPASPALHRRQPATSQAV
jgi:hypothetical protein